MEKFNAEILITSLIAMGFERVDSVLFTLTLGMIFANQRKSKVEKYEFEEKEFSNQFKTIFCINNGGYQLREGMDLHSNISPCSKFNYSVYEFLTAKARRVDFIDYLLTIDFEEIVLKKLKMLGDGNKECFCAKEMAIISNSQRKGEALKKSFN